MFTRYAFDGGVLTLGYAYKNGPEFEEKIVFPRPFRALSATEAEALDRVFRLIFLLAGVSYYKAYIPSTLRTLAFPLDARTAAFLAKVYLNGLGEFAFKNDVAVDPRFVVDTQDAAAPLSLVLPHGNLVAVGGGKDSIVTIECLKKAAEPVTLFAVGSGLEPAGPIRATIEKARAPSLVVTRTLSATLLDLNQKDALNGHVPITGILSGIAVACAILYGFDAVVFSNENSASAPNVKRGDLEVNHQYSKSLAFEKDFSDLIRATVSPDIGYFSFLRPLTEAEIARRFAGLETYHSIFRSCNTAFRQDEKRRGKNWCCDCPKCRFVFLALAPFIEKSKLVDIFGLDLLEQANQTEGFSELCGLSAHKPFECVGEVEESALLMVRLSRMEAWKDSVVVASLAPQLLAAAEGFERNYKALFENRPDHNVPEKYLGMLNACQGSAR